MQRLTASPASGLSPAQHGEGPTWDAGRGELLWVDIQGGLVRRAAVDAEGTFTETGVHRGGDTVGAVVPAAGGGWLLAADGGFTHLAADGTARVLLALAGEGGEQGRRRRSRPRPRHDTHPSHGRSILTGCPKPPSTSPTCATTEESRRTAPMPPTPRCARTSGCSAGSSVR